MGNGHGVTFCLISWRSPNVFSYYEPYNVWMSLYDFVFRRSQLWDTRNNVFIVSEKKRVCPDGTTERFTLLAFQSAVFVFHIENVYLDFEVGVGNKNMYIGSVQRAYTIITSYNWLGENARARSKSDDLVKRARDAGGREGGKKKEL